MKLPMACLAMLLLLLSLVPGRALYINRNMFDESARLQPVLPSGRDLRQLQPALPSGRDLRQLMTAGRQRRSRLPACKRMKQEMPPICANDVECQRHYLQYVDNMVRMMDAGRRRR